MSAPSSLARRPSSMAVQKQQSNKMMMCPEQLTRQLSNMSNEGHYHREESASVPFTWESQPGTPKVKFRENTLPPLTPPPSYFYSPANKRPITKASKKNSSKPNLLQTIFPKRTTRKGRLPPPSPASYPSLSFSSSSSSSFSSSSHSSGPRQKSHSVPSSPMIYSRKDEDDEDLYDMPVTSLCFGNAGLRGCYSSMIKKVLQGDFL